MANKEHLKILKQGVKAWNKWRDKYPDIKPDLSNVTLSGRYSNSYGIGGYLVTNYVGANFRGANLTNADFSWAGLANADLSCANLTLTRFDGAILDGTDLTSATLGHTRFVLNNLSQVRGLETLIHLKPSYISIDTLYKSGGSIPEAFLRGCGVPDTFIIFARSLTITALDFYSCFISYSSKNQDFADRLYADLQNKGVRCWFAPEDLKIGDRFQERIEDSIRVYDKLLIILSEDSISSRWVEREVNAAFEHEQNQNRTMLFPIRLDEAVMNCNQAWAAEIRRSHHIGDFTGWKDHDSYQKAFARLMRDLKAESSVSDA